MPSRKSITETIPSCLGSGYLQGKLRFLAVLIGCTIGLTGCQRFPGSQAMRQYQLESDRLLAANDARIAALGEQLERAALRNRIKRLFGLKA